MNNKEFKKAIEELEAVCSEGGQYVIFCAAEVGEGEMALYYKGEFSTEFGEVMLDQFVSQLPAEITGIPETETLN